jgi:hypothetical protein
MAEKWTRMFRLHFSLWLGPQLPPFLSLLFNQTKQWLYKRRDDILQYLQGSMGTKFPRD